MDLATHIEICQTGMLAFGCTGSGAGFVLLLVMLFSMFRLVLHFIDTTTITEAARQKGWTEVSVRWSPFAPGWLFERGERHYRVSFTDKDGLKKSQYCKTGIFTGVFWRD
jgi:hypothetical protein